MYSPADKINSTMTWRKVNSSIAEQTVAFGMELPVYAKRDRLRDSLRKPGDFSRYEYKNRLSKLWRLKQYIKKGEKAVN
jgi:hypothetical protein